MLFREITSLDIGNFHKECIKNRLRDSAYYNNLSRFSRKNLSRNRNSRPEVFCKEGVLRNFAKFTGKHLCQTLFFNKVASLGLQLY